MAGTLRKVTRGAKAQGAVLVFAVVRRCAVVTCVALARAISRIACPLARTRVAVARAACADDIRRRACQCACILGAGEGVEKNVTASDGAGNDQ